MTLDIIWLAASIGLALVALGFIVRTRRARRVVRGGVILPVFILAGALASAGVAAFSVFSNTVGGSASGTFTSTVNSTPALTFTQTSQSGNLDPAGPNVTYTGTLHNNDTVAHNVLSTTVTFTVSGATSTGGATNAICASDLSVASENLTGSSPPPGTDATGRTIVVHVAPGTPAGCASATVSMAVSGTTS